MSPTKNLWITDDNTVWGNIMNAMNVQRSPHWYQLNLDSLPFPKRHYITLIFSESLPIDIRMEVCSAWLIPDLYVLNQFLSKCSLLVSSQ